MNEQKFSGNGFSETESSQESETVAAKIKLLKFIRVGLAALALGMPVQAQNAAEQGGFTPAPDKEKIEVVIKKDKKRPEITEDLRAKKEARIQKDLQKIIGEYAFTAIPDKVEEKSNEKTPEVGQLSVGELEGAITEEEVRAVLETLPKGWVDGQIASIKEKPEEEAPPVDALYKERQELWVSAHTLCSYENPAEIKFYRSKRKERQRLSVEEIMVRLYHEIGHGNSYSCDDQMSRLERFELLDRILQRISEPDRYMSSYVETLEAKDGTRESTMFFKANEYWAVIVSKYFSDPNELNNVDFLIINNLIKKYDPQYNAIKSAAQRRKIVSAIKQDIKSRKKELKNANKETELAVKINSPDKK